MASVLPTFSESGYVTNPLEKLDFLLAHFFTTQPAQTHYFKDSIKSFQTILAGKSEDISDGQMRTEMETYLTDYLLTQFDKVELSVQLKPADGDENNNQLLMEIQCDFVADGKTYSMGYGIEMMGTICQRIFRINETGDDS